ncbi:MAG: hypothetical protein Q9183_005252 [Haloplaca sp. 2 TL-2023]
MTICEDGRKKDTTLNKDKYTSRGENTPPDDLLHKNQELQERIKSLNTTNGRLETDLSAAVSRAGQADAEKSQALEAKAQTEKDMEILQTERQKADDRCTKLENDASIMRSDLQKANEASAKKSNRLDQTREQLKAERAEKEAVGKHLAKAQGSLKETEAKLSQAGATISEHEETIQRLQAENGQQNPLLQQALAENHQLKQAYTGLQQQVIADDQVKRSLQDQIEGMKKKLHECEASWHFHKTHHDRYHVAVRKIAEDLMALEKVGQLPVVDWLPILYETMKNSFYEMKQQKEEKEKECAGLRATNARLQRELSTAQGELKKCEEAMNTLKQGGGKWPHSFESTMTMLRTVTKERDDLKREKGKWAETMKKIKGEAEEAAATLRGSRENNAFYTKRIAEVQDECTRLREEGERVASICTSLQGVEQNFETEKARRAELERLCHELKESNKRVVAQRSRLIAKEMAKNGGPEPSQGPEKRDRGGEPGDGDDGDEKEGEPTKKGKRAQWA